MEWLKFTKQLPGGESLRFALYGAAVTALFFILRPAPVAPVQQELTQKVQEAEKTAVHARRTVTKITKPDGTKIEQIQEDIKSTKETAKQSEVKLTVRDTKTRYRLGLDYVSDFKSVPTYLDLQLRGGARLGDTNFWAEAGFNLKFKAVTIGVTYEW